MEVENTFKERPQKQPRAVMNKKSLPTHFLAIRIVSESTIKSVADIQARLAQMDERLQRDLIKSPKLHMTLCVMTLDTRERIEEAIKRLHSSVDLLKRHYPSNGPRLDFAALNHFRNRILFLEAAEDLERAKLKEFVRDLVAHFEGIAIKEHREWTPHVTVYKPRTGRACLPDSITELLRTRCGPHEFMHVDLLRMAGKGVAGYYPCLASVPFGANPPAIYIQQQLQLSHLVPAARDAAGAGVGAAVVGAVAVAAADGSGSEGEDAGDE